MLTAPTARGGRFAASALLVASLLAALAPSASARSGVSDTPPYEDVTVYVAREIVTMEPGQPTATAVAVDGATGRIIDVGSLDSMAPWLENQPHNVDRRFKKKVLLPGFIDPHVHPFLAGKLLSNEIAAPEDWNLPSGRVPAITTREDFVERLAAVSYTHLTLPTIYSV